MGRGRDSSARGCQESRTRRSSCFLFWLLFLKKESTAPHTYKQRHAILSGKHGAATSRFEERLESRVHCQNQLVGAHVCLQQKDSGGKAKAHVFRGRASCGEPRNGQVGRKQTPLGPQQVLLS